MPTPAAPLSLGALGERRPRLGAPGPDRRATGDEPAGHRHPSGAVSPTGERTAEGRTTCLTSRGASPTATPGGGGTGCRRLCQRARALVNDVADHAPAWAQTDAARRADLLQRVIASTMDAQDAWLAAACDAKGIRPAAPRQGEELFAGIGTFVRMARLLRDALLAIAKDGKPAFPGPVRQAPDGRLRVQVFPDGAFDRVTFAQTTAEVWMQPGVTREALVAEQAAAYADPVAHTGTALVLAAGNVASLGPRDALSKLFVEGKVVVMKANPVNDYLVPHWSRALAPLIDVGVLRIVDGRCLGRAVPDGGTRASTRCTSPGRTRPTTPSSSARGRRCATQGSRRARARQAGDGRAGKRVTRHRRAGQVVDRRAALPGRARGHHAGQQRGLQLHLGPCRHHPRPVAPA